ncbi:MAG: glycosyltransferase family 8 protein [Oscillospiraceae bacterium]|jgi:lipopolysaccharide biosynthesis glycosyltransferase|nr:glycosyltransferase family 8 protein [Oscillospiraceae bacterium]
MIFKNFLKILLAFACTVILIFNELIFPATIFTVNEQEDFIKPGVFEPPINVVITIDSNYVKFATVSMTSLVLNALKDTYYNVYVMVPDDFTDENKKQLESVKNINNNITFEFLKMGKSCNMLSYKNGDFSKPYDRFLPPAYYRLFIAATEENKHSLPEETVEKLQKISRCIYIDVDTIILRDLTELYNEDLKGNLIGGVADELRSNIFKKDNSNLETSGIFKDNFDDYINSGVLLMDLKKMRESNISSKFIDFGIEKRINEGIPVHDQCIINKICHGNIKTLKFENNVLTFMRGIDCSYKDLKVDSTKELFEENDWNQGRENPRIIHYAGGLKPWNNLNVFHAEYWWKNVACSSCESQIYEEYLSRKSSDEKYQVNKFVVKESNIEKSLKSHQNPEIISIIIPVEDNESWLRKNIWKILNIKSRNIGIIFLIKSNSDIKSVDFIKSHLSSENFYIIENYSEEDVEKKAVAYVIKVDIKNKKIQYSCPKLYLKNMDLDLFSIEDNTSEKINWFVKNIFKNKADVAALLAGKIFNFDVSEFFCNFKERFQSKFLTKKNNLS